MQYISKLEHDKPIKLADQVCVQEGQIVSKTIAQNKYVSLTLFAFSKGEEIGTHDSKGDAMVQILEGVGQFKVGDKVHVLGENETLIMPATVPHSVYAKEDFKMLLTVVFPTEE